MIKRSIPLASMEALLKNCGAGRISNKAKEALREILESYVADIGAVATKLASHAGRKTLKGTDIKLASK